MMFENGRVISFLVATGIATGLLMTTSVSRAAVPRKIQGSEIAPSKVVLLKATREALEMPIANRLESLQQQGGEGYRNLVMIMFDEKSPMELRWRATTAAGRIGGNESVPELKRALKRNEWYMRSAALVALKSVDRSEALTWSKKLLSDKALVVRASAVSTIEELKDTSSTQLLWKKLYAKENFKGSQSLFIRHRILMALSKIEQPGHEAKFIETLSDKDPALHGPAIAALERLTQQHLGTSAEPMTFKRDRWQKWFKEHSHAKAVVPPAGASTF